MRAAAVVLMAALLAAMSTAAGPARVRLPNGARIVSAPEPGSEWVMVSAFVAIGADTDTDKPGIRSVTAQAAYQRRKTVGKKELDDVSVHVGGGVRLSVERDYVRYDVLTTRPWSANALFLAVGALKDAGFTQEDVDAAKQAIKATVSATESPAAFGLKTLARRAFGQHAYAHEVSAEDVDSVTLADCQRYYRSCFVPQRVTLVLAGAIEGTGLADSAATTLGEWDAGTQPVVAPPELHLDDSFDTVRSRDTASAYVMAGCMGPAPNSPDFAAFAVLAAVLGKGQESRLPQALRANGQAYQVGTSLLPTVAGSLLYTWTQFNPTTFDSATGTSSSVAGTTRRAVRDTVTELFAKGPTDEELARAKRVLAVDYMLADPPNHMTAAPFTQGHQRLRDRAFWLGWWEMIGCGFEEDQRFPDLVERVTADDVAKVAKKYGKAVGTVMVIPENP